MVNEDPETYISLMDLLRSELKDYLKKIFMIYYVI